MCFCLFTFSIINKISVTLYYRYQFSLLTSCLLACLLLTYWLCPDFAELDVFLGQHILLTLEQHFNPKI